MELDERSTLMELFTKESGKITSTVAKAVLICRTETAMKERLKMDSFMGRACRTCGPEVSTGANFRKDLSMVKATLFGKITAGIKARSSQIIWMAWEVISGPMALSTRVSGAKEKCRDRVHSE